MRSVSVLRTIFRIAVSLQHMHSAPVSIEFIGKNARQAGSDAVSHLRPMRNDVDRSVGVNADENTGMERGRAHRGGGASGSGPERLRENPGAEDEGPGREHALKKTAAADIFDGDHAV